MAKLHILAALALQCVNTATRADGTKYTKLTEGRPDWVQQMVMKAHDGMMPDDFKYEVIKEALELISNDPSLDDEEIADLYQEMEVDIYYGSLVKWLGSDQARSCYMTEELREGEHKDFFTLIQSAQLREKQEIFGLVLSSLLAHQEEEGEDDSDED